MKILIADDHPFILQGVTAYVTSLGYSVETCDNGITALNYIKTHRPDISILDVKMPGMSGLEVLEYVAKHKLQTKVVLLTMYKERSLFEKAKKLNVFGYLLKNHGQEELLTCLTEVVENRQYFSPQIMDDLIAGKPVCFNDKISKLTVTEKKVLKLVSEHHTSKKIAELLFVSEKTIEGHRRNIISKLDLPKKKNSLLHWALSNLRD